MSNQHLTHAELEVLVHDASQADRAIRDRKILMPSIRERIGRLIAENRELREQQAARERHNHEQAQS